jgi:DNA topoisomerase-2
MREKEKASIKASKGTGGWTRVTFKPDWSLFKIDGFDDDMVALLKKRVYDMAGTCHPKGLNVR